MIRTLSRPSYKPKYWPVEPGCALYLEGQQDPQSSTIRDLSGYGNHGTIYGATWVRESKGFWILSYDGADDYTACADSTSLRPTSLCIRVWVNVPDWTPAAYSVLTGKSLNALATSATFICALTGAGGLFRLQIERITGAQYPTWDYDVSGFPVNTWHCFEISHIRSAYNATDTIMIVDGVEVATTYTANGHAAAALEYAAYPVSIGGVRGAAVTSYKAAGKIWLAYLGTARTATQAIGDYQKERWLFGV